jgi:hypothetical protein
MVRMNLSQRNVDIETRRLIERRVTDVLDDADDLDRPWPLVVVVDQETSTDGT